MVIHSTFSTVPVSRLDELQPREFEKLACWAFQNLGYLQVIHSGAKSTTDGGADVRMRNQKGENEIVQCKQLTRRIDQTELKKFTRAMRIFDAERGHYWAPAGFTDPAMEYANTHKIIWYDEQRILRTISAAYKEIERRKQLAIAAGGYVEPKTKPRSNNLPYQARRKSDFKISCIYINEFHNNYCDIGPAHVYTLNSNNLSCSMKIIRCV